MLPPYKFPLHCVNFMDHGKWRTTHNERKTRTSKWLLNQSNIALGAKNPSQSSCVALLNLCVWTNLGFSLSLSRFCEFQICIESREVIRRVSTVCAFSAWWHKYPFDLIFNHIMYHCIVNRMRMCRLCVYACCIDREWHTYGLAHAGTDRSKWCRTAVH